MQLSCPEFPLRGWQRCQCAASRCRAAAFRCEKFRFHQGCALGAPDVTVGPSHFAARPQGVAARRKVRGVKRGQETIPGVLSPFAPAVGTAFSGRRRRPLPTPSEGVKSPPAASRCIGGGISTAEGKEKGGRRGLPDRRFLTLKKIFGVFSKKRLTLSLAYANLYTG